MDEAKIEEMVKRILSEELSKNNDSTKDNGISPLLKDIRDDVLKKIGNDSVEKGTGSPLLEDIKNEVEKSIN